MGNRRFGLRLALVALAVVGPAQAEETWKIIGWNDLGMHCMDADYSVFSILPPYNTVHAHAIDLQGNLVTDPVAAGISVTFEAVADPSGSINTTSAHKTNFWEHVGDLFGASPPVDQGLTGTLMPGPLNQPQPMEFDAAFNWFTGEGIPITSYDDGYKTNTYPMVRLVLRDHEEVIRATTDVVLPVSMEMSCRSCHGSDTVADARPSSGWVHDPDVERDYRLNILKLHDDEELGDPDYTDALAAAGHDPGGLYVTVVEQGRSILCASCHPTNALPGTGLPGVPPVTRAVHDKHAEVTDPASGMLLDDSNNRAACYTCHPGATTQCLRGAMGASVDSSSELSIQCQSCHGNMSAVGAEERVGWLDQPTCQNCHTGTAMNNNGQIRYLTAFEGNGQPRQAVDATYATNADTPAPGFSLYRFSVGHGGLQCESCHGSTHAVYPSAHHNDNIQNEDMQGHAGTLVECASCHQETPETFDGGPHGLHPVGEPWVDHHSDAAQVLGIEVCRDCHGSDYRSTVLSVSQADRTLTHNMFGSRFFWRGARVSCYACHDGPSSETLNPNLAPVAVDDAVATPFETPVDRALVASDSDGPFPLELRIVDQPEHGRVGLAGSLATYVPYPGFAGADHFTFAAWDGEIDSNLAVVDVNVAGPTSPSPVPDGSIGGDPLRVVKLPGGLVRLEWDVLSCPGPGYHLVWYDLTGVASYTITDLECAAGATGEWVGQPPSGPVGVVVVPDDLGDVEGSHGLASGGAERSSTATDCGFLAKNTDGVCL